ncbi:MAG: ABC transporter substrate-binding protein [Gammaproteobacteria bacterium]|nr:ABC transporter substrate-binding protein [Gammaproteobacteria bacterium]
MVFHSVGMETDFGPFAQEIIDAKPDAVVTGNWGTDMILLGQELGAANLDIPIYTLYGAFAGTTSAIGEDGNGKIHLVHGGEYNPAPPGQARLYRAYKEVYPESDLSSLRLIYTIEFLAKAIEKAGTDDPLEVALAMEGMQYESASGRMVRMRKSDHQIIQPLAISVQTDEDIEFDISNTGIGLKTVMIVESDKLAQLPTSCNMQRPQQLMTGAR